jgi:hypothetical protein
MNEEFLKLLDKVSLSLLRDIGRLEEELGEMDQGEAAEVSASIPAILLAIAVQRLCQTLPPDEVSTLLQAMTAKVEIGDFHKGAQSGQQADPPPDQCACTDGEEDGGKGGEDIPRQN